MVFTFILLLIAKMFVSFFTALLAKRGRIISALFLIVVMWFLNPLILIWILHFLFGYYMEYWYAFLTLTALDVFTFHGYQKLVQEI